MNTIYHWRLYHGENLLCWGETDTERKATLRARKAYKARMAGAGEAAYTIRYTVDSPIYESNCFETFKNGKWTPVGISTLVTRKR